MLLDEMKDSSAPVWKNETLFSKRSKKFFQSGPRPKSLVKCRSPVAPSIHYNYEEQNDVPNPHNYWDDKPTLSVKDEKVVEEKVTVEAKETIMAIPVNPMTMTDKQLPNITSEEMPPKPCMPSRATFAS
jgi:hypothetical protein